MQKSEKKIIPGVKILAPVVRDGKSNVPRNDKCVFSPLNTRFSQVGENGSLGGKLLVNVDWLTLRIADTLSKIVYDEDGFYSLEGTNFRFLKLDYSTPLFHNICKVFYGELPVAEIQYGARMKVNAGSAYIKYENYVFYEKAFIEDSPTEIFTKLIQSLGSEILGVTRLDIAVDGVNLTQFIEDYRLGKYEKLKNSNISVTYSDKARGMDYFTVGSRGGKKYAACYRKKTEIEEKNYKKRYILEHWAANGLDTSQEVWRFEIRLNSDAMKDMQGFRFSEDMFTIENLISIFNFQIANFFEFVPSNSSDSRRSRREKVVLFKFDFKPSVYVRVKRQTLEGNRTVKILAKRLIKDAYLSGGTKMYANFTVVAQLVSDCCLEGWLTYKSHDIVTEIEKYAKVRGIDLPEGLAFDVLTDISKNSLIYE